MFWQSCAIVFYRMGNETFDESQYHSSYLPTGHIDLMKKYFKKMLWPSYNLPHALKERGVDDEAKLPNFYYREDALKLWNAIGVFV